MSPRKKKTKLQLKQQKKQKKKTYYENALKHIQKGISPKQKCNQPGVAQANVTIPKKQITIRKSKRQQQTLLPEVEFNHRDSVIILSDNESDITADTRTSANSKKDCNNQPSSTKQLGNSNKLVPVGKNSETKGNTQKQKIPRITLDASCYIVSEDEETDDENKEPVQQTNNEAAINKPNSEDIEVVWSCINNPSKEEQSIASKRKRGDKTSEVEEKENKQNGGDSTTKYNSNTSPSTPSSSDDESGPLVKIPRRGPTTPYLKSGVKALPKKLRNIQINPSTRVKTNEASLPAQSKVNSSSGRMDKNADQPTSSASANTNIPCFPVGVRVNVMDLPARTSGKPSSLLTDAKVDSASSCTRRWDVPPILSADIRAQQTSLPAGVNANAPNFPVRVSANQPSLPEDMTVNTVGLPGSVWANPSRLPAGVSVNAPSLAAGARTNSSSLPPSVWVNPPCLPAVVSTNQPSLPAGARANASGLSKDVSAKQPSLSAGRSVSFDHNSNSVPSCSTSNSSSDSLSTCISALSTTACAPRTDHCPGELREIVVDGNNVGMMFTNGKTFAEMGIKLVVDHFQKAGHTVKVFVPHYRRSLQHPILDQLHKEGIVIFTPSRHIGGKRITPYDDRYIIQYATMCGGIIISSDQFRDLYMEKPEWRETIEKRLLMPTYVGNYILFPEDPLGRGGPKLDEFLRH